MKLNRPLFFSSLILTAFTIYFIIKGNYEFLLYTVTIGLLIWILIKTDKIFKYSNLAKWGFAVWLFSHLAGGAFRINGVRLYDIILFNIIPEYNILRYDQLIHGFCYFVITLLVYSIVLYATKPKTNKYLIWFIVFATSLGISALNEIIELSTVVFFHSTGVGDYFNNAFDLVFNAIGAILAIIIVNLKSK